MKRALLLATVTAAMLLPAVPASAQTSSEKAGVVQAANRRGHSRRHYRYHRRPRFSVGFGYWGWGGWYGPPYHYGYGYPYGYGYYGRPRGYYPSPDWAAIDTDVSPEESAVYLDGTLIGSADDFDGYPDYLYLKRGRYRLEFRLEGYEPKSIEVDSRPGMKLRIDESLRKVPGAKQYGSYEPAVPEGSVRRFWGKRRNATEAIDDEDEIYGAVPDRRYRDYDRDDDDEDEVEAEPADEDDEDDDEADRPRDRRGVRTDDWRGGRGVEREYRDGARLKIEAEPLDAVVFFDDRFVGTAQELGSLSRGVSVSPGKHTVTVSRPGYKDKTVEVSVEAGETKEVEIQLSR